MGKSSCPGWGAEKCNIRGERREQDGLSVLELCGFCEVARRL